MRQNILMRTTLLALAFLGACAGSYPPPADLTAYSDQTFASKQLCEHAVSNVDRARFLSTTIPAEKKGLFDTTSYEIAHRDRVQHCTARLTERQAACIAQAPSLQYVHNCEAFPELQ
jgi:hypothetical protein